MEEIRNKLLLHYCTKIAFSNEQINLTNWTQSLCLFLTYPLTIAWTPACISNVRTAIFNFQIEFFYESFTYLHECTFVCTCFLNNQYSVACTVYGLFCIAEFGTATRI